MLQQWASTDFATDWGTRAVSDHDPKFDPISYHRGSIWPLFTGWTAVAQYRAGRPLAGWDSLRRNVDLTWAQDPGAVTELLSGRFYEPLGRSTTHQLWSSAMVLAPALREVLGFELDAPAHTLLVHPHLPPAWDEASAEHVHVGDAEFRVREQRIGPALQVTALSATPTVLCLGASADLTTPSEPCRAPASTTHTLSLPLPPLELALPATGLLAPGADTAQPRVIDELCGARSMEITVQALAGSKLTLAVRRNGPAARAAHTTDGQLTGDHLQISLPPGTGFVKKRIAVVW